MPIDLSGVDVNSLNSLFPAPKKAGLARRVFGDTAVDLGKGVVQLGDAAIGLADLATVGAAGDAIKSMGYDSQAIQQGMDEYYTPQRQAAEQEVQNAEGFLGKVGALATNPSALIGRGVQSAPMLLGTMGAAGKAYQATNSLRAATAAGHIAEGALTAGSVAQDIRNQGGSRGDMYWAVPAGVATGAIGYGAGRLLPEGQIETLMVPGARAATASGQPVGLMRRVGTSAFSEGVLEEAPQSGSEQMFTNVGTGKPLMYQVPEAIGEGLATGAAMGGVLGPLQRHSAPPTPTNLLPGANGGSTALVPLGQRALVPQQPPLVEPEVMPRYAAPNNLLLPPAGPRTTADFPVNGTMYVTGGGTATPNMLALSGSQPDLFGAPDVLPGQESPTDQRRAWSLREMAASGEPTSQSPMMGETGALFQAHPDALVRTEYGLPQITAALRHANGGKANAQLLRFVPEFSRAIEQGPAAVDALIAKYDTSRSTLKPEVFETAAQMAQDFASRATNAQAAGGLYRNEMRPADGWVWSNQVGDYVPDRSTYTNNTQGQRGDSAQIAREQNSALQMREQRAAGQQQLAGQIADTDARVAGAQQQRTAQARRALLDTVLEGSANAGNARNRFIKALRKQGFRDTMVSPDEQTAIGRFFNAKETFPDESAPLPSAPNEMGDVVPEKTAPVAAKPGKPARTNENRAFQLTPPPSTDADLAALEKAQAKRERKAGVTPEAPAEEPVVDKSQGKLFTTRGKPTVAASNEPPAPRAKPAPKAKVEAKVEEAAPESPTKAKYEFVTQGFDAPAYDSLTDQQRGQIDDLANRDQLNLAAVNNIVSKKTENVDTSEKRVEKAAKTEQVTNGDLKKNTPVSDKEFAERVQRTFDKLKSKKGAQLDLNDESQIESFIEQGDLQSAWSLMREIVQEMKERRYRTREGSNAPANAISEADLQKIVDDVQKALGGDAGVTILDSVTDLDPDEKPGSRAGKLQGNKVYLFRDGIPNGIEGLKTVFHELFHKGLRALLPKQQYFALMNKLYDQSAELRKLANAWMDAHKTDVASEIEQYDSEADKSAAARALAVEEVLAEKAEAKAFGPSTLRQLGNWFADVADKLGLKKLGQWLRSAGVSPLQQFIDDAIKASVDGSAAWGVANRPGTDAFARWFGDSKTVDANGDPVVIYRGIMGNDESALNGESREGYATFGSDSPFVANSYGNPDFNWDEIGTVMPMYVKADKLIEFPVTEDRHGTRRFDKFAFDRRAQSLRPGEVLVARQVIDIGPRASAKVDPDKLYSYYSDIYAWGKGTSVKSATGNNGNYDLKNPDSRYRTATVDEAKAAASDMAEVIKTNIFGKARRFVLSSSFLRNIQEKYGSKLNGVDQCTDKTFEMSADAAEKQQETRVVADALMALEGKEADQVSDLMAEATINEVALEPTKERNNSHLIRGDGTVDPIVQELQSRFNRLNDRQKDAYRKARDGLAKFWKERGERLAEKTNQTYDPLIKEAERAGDEKLVKQYERERRDFLAENNAALASLKGDYFPLMRFGEWVVTKKSAAYEKLADQVEAAHKALNNLYDKYDKHSPEQRKAITELNRKRKARGEEVIGEYTDEEAAEIKAARDEYNKLLDKLESMKANEDDYYMAQFESEGEATLHKKKIGGKLSLRREYDRDLSPVSAATLKRFEESLAASMRARGNEEALRDAKKAMYGVFLASLPERSALKRTAKRKKVAGFGDMRRAVISSMLRDSFYLSRMKFADQIADGLNLAYNDADDQGDVRLKEVANELARRMSASMNYVDTPVQDLLAGATYVYRLGVSPGYLIANMIQPFTVSIPMLWARHGAKSNAAFGRAYADVAGLVNKSRKINTDGEIEFHNAGLADDEVAMLEHMLTQRLLNVTLVADLARTADGKKTSKWLSMTAKPSHFVEVVNRMSTALAAYRLEKAKSGNEAAVAYAQRVLKDTHFDYSTENAPYWMKPGTVPMNKVMFQFKKYQLGMISLFARTAATIAKGEGVERKEAVKQMMGLLTTHAAIGGVFGVPAIGTLMTIATLIGKAFGDDDEPWDARIALRNWLYDNFGKEAGDVLAKGLPTLIDVDMSQKAGLGDLLNPVPTLRADKSGRDFALELLATGMGPFFGSVMPDMFEAASYYAKGDFLKGTEKILPKAASDLIKAYRFADEGITTKQGTVAVSPDEISAWDAAMQAIGVPSSSINDSYEARAAQQNVVSGLRNTAGEVKKDWLEAKLAGDEAEASDVWKRIQEEVNPVRRRNGLEPITMGALLQFKTQRAKEEGKYAKFGAPTNAKMAELGRFARD